MTPSGAKINDGSGRLSVSWRVKKTIVMVGMMWAGKTPVGTQLARRLSVPFVDSDEEIVKAANRSIAEIVERDGEAFFRRKEAQVIGRLLKGRPGVLSTGGGAFLQDENRFAITSEGVSVWLKADLPLLWSRVRHRNTRPLLRTDDPHATLAALFKARKPLYTQADLAVEAGPETSVEEMAAKVIEALLTRPDVLERG